MAHVCLRRVEPELIYKLMRDESITMFCAAPTVLISIANAPQKFACRRARGIRLFTAGAPPAAATIELVERDLGWELTHVYGLTETSPLITVCELLPEHSTPLKNWRLSKRVKVSSWLALESCESSMRKEMKCLTTVKRSARLLSVATL